MTKYGNAFADIPFNARFVLVGNSAIAGVKADGNVRVDDLFGFAATDMDSIHGKTIVVTEILIEYLGSTNTYINLYSSNVGMAKVGGAGTSLREMDQFNAIGLYTGIEYRMNAGDHACISGSVGGADDGIVTLRGYVTEKRGTVVGSADGTTLIGPGAYHQSATGDAEVLQRDVIPHSGKGINQLFLHGSGVASTHSAIWENTTGRSVVIRKMRLHRQDNTTEATFGYDDDGEAANYMIVARTGDLYSDATTGDVVLTDLGVEIPPDKFLVVDNTAGSLEAYFTFVIDYKTPPNAFYIANEHEEALSTDDEVTVLTVADEERVMIMHSLMAIDDDDVDGYVSWDGLGTGADATAIPIHKAIGAGNHALSPNHQLVGKDRSHAYQSFTANAQIWARNDNDDGAAAKTVWTYVEGVYI